jgi:hypothetical protein
VFPSICEFIGNTLSSQVGVVDITAALGVKVLPQLSLQLVLLQATIAAAQAVLMSI